jgi:hypothetical protein
MGFLSSKKPSNQLSCVNNIMLYKELIREPQENKTLARKLAEWIAKLQSSSKSQQQNDGHGPSMVQKWFSWLLFGL